jgi:hypothetical protein
MRKSGFLPTLLVLAAAVAQAEDRAQLETTQVIGSRELPKVLYIVPWKQPLPGDLVGRPVASLLDEALAPVDRDVFRRQVQYHAAVQGMSSDKTATQTPAAKSGTK